MAKWFRSEPMEYISLILNEDAAHDCLADLGKMGILQFTDVSTSCGAVNETKRNETERNETGLTSKISQRE